MQAQAIPFSEYAERVTIQPTMTALYAVSFSGSYEGFGAYVAFLIVGCLIFTLFGLLLLPMLIIAGLARRQAERFKNQRESTVVAQYEPPHGFTPAEVGLLYDMRCTERDVLATLFELEQRGIVSVVNQHTVKVIDEAAYSGLKEYEKIAIQIAHGDVATNSGPTFVSITSIDPETGATTDFEIRLPSRKTLLAFTVAVQNAVRAKGIKMKNYYGTFALRVICVAFLLGLLPLATAAMPITSNGVDYGAWSPQSIGNALLLTVILGFFLVPVYAVTALVLVWLWTKIAGRYWLNSRQVRALWPELEGYRLYLKQVDIDNIQAEASAGQVVTKTLPYAIVFGLDTRWREWLANRRLLV